MSNDEMLDEYDLSKLKQVGPRGKYAKRYREGTNVVVIDEDLHEAFPTPKAVNDALRKVLQDKDDNVA